MVRDLDQVAEAFGKACSDDVAQACYNLAAMIFSGEVGEDGSGLGNALDLFDHSCELGDDVGVMRQT